jgi:hypothetical protein
MTNIITFPTPNQASPDFSDEIGAIQNEARMLLRMADELARHRGSAHLTTNHAGEMEAVLASMNCAIAALKQMAKPFLKSQAQLDAEWRDFERQFLS